MTFMTIDRLYVDPVTFQETVGIRYFPRLEDTVFDEQLTTTPQAFASPRYRRTTSISAKNNATQRRPVSPPSLVETPYRPPTPPKARDEGANSPRKSPPQNIKNLKDLVSPRGRKNKKLEMSLSKIFEESPKTEVGDGSESSSSISDLNAAFLTSIVRSPAGKKALSKIDRHVRFQDEVEENEISRLRQSMIAELFYASEDLAEFRYEAFMEEAGLDIADFD
ncbi:hypothetical protein IV203_030129 [Nitzschia inconspicua]|uniref:Uncharacterized protein n=1 Tax=Nitzschia inconspicua TaxID=303405 RepID=A0A9K3LT01_9STRA|nr:hypothetical protein IV203_030129 [Nitzschia inconspicua]